MVKAVQKNPTPLTAATYHQYDQKGAPKAQAESAASNEVPNSRGQSKTRHELWARDLQLAQDATCGDRNALEQIATRLFDRVRCTIRYLAATEPDADDCTQMVMIEILRSIHGFSGNSTLETWADRVTTRTAMRMLKRKHRLDWLFGTPIPEGATAQEPTKKGQPDSQFLQTEARRYLAGALQRLSVERRVAIVLHEVHHYSVAEIAELQNSPLYTVRDRLKKGRKLLRDIVSRDPRLREVLEGSRE